MGLIRRARRLGLSSLFHERTVEKVKRDGVIRGAYIKHGCTLSQIGEFAGLHYATISRIVKGREGANP